MIDGTCRLEGPILNCVARRIRNDANFSSGRLIAVEALDGVGKSTTVRKLAERFAGIALSSPITQVFKETRAAVDTVAFTDPLSRFRFYREANRADSRQPITEALTAGQMVFLDRYFLSTVVGNAALGADLNEDEEVLNDGNRDVDIIVPDATIWLRLNEASRRERLQLRITRKEKAAPDHNMDNDLKLQARMAALYGQLIEYGLIPIDIDELTTDDVVEKVVRTLKENGILL